MQSVRDNPEAYASGELWWQDVPPRLLLSEWMTTHAKPERAPAEAVWPEAPTHEKPLAYATRPSRCEHNNAIHMAPDDGTLHS